MPVLRVRVRAFDEVEGVLVLGGEGEGEGEGGGLGVRIMFSAKVRPLRRFCSEAIVCFVGVDGIFGWLDGVVGILGRVFR